MQPAIRDITLSPEEEKSALSWLETVCARPIVDLDCSIQKDTQRIFALYTTATGLNRRSDFGHIVKIARETAEAFLHLWSQNSSTNENTLVLLGFVIDSQYRCVCALSAELSENSEQNISNNSVSQDDRRIPVWNAPTIDLSSACSAQEMRLTSLLQILSQLPSTEDRLMAARCILSALRDLEKLENKNS